MSYYDILLTYSKTGPHQVFILIINAELINADPEFIILVINDRMVHIVLIVIFNF